MAVSHKSYLPPGTQESKAAAPGTTISFWGGIHTLKGEGGSGLSTKMIVTNKMQLVVIKFKMHTLL